MSDEYLPTQRCFYSFRPLALNKNHIIPATRVILMSACELLAGFEGCASRGADDIRRGRDERAPPRCRQRRFVLERPVLTTSYYAVPVYAAFAPNQLSDPACLPLFVAGNDVTNSPFLIEKVSSTHISHGVKFLYVLKISVTFEMRAPRKRFNFFTNFIST